MGAVRLDLPTFSDPRGSLTVLERALPFAPRRVYFVHGVPAGATRGGHRHLRNRQVLVCVAGSCEVLVRRKGETEAVVLLDSPSSGLLLEPEEWHLMRAFSPGAVLLVLASEPYDPADAVGGP
jgi:dTDP-4-dehydrorhamnose 3,5-epimerase-like enzyme